MTFVSTDIPSQVEPNTSFKVKWSFKNTWSNVSEWRFRVYIGDVKVDELSATINTENVKAFSRDISAPSTGNYTFKIQSLFNHPSYGWVKGVDYSTDIKVGEPRLVTIGKTYNVKTTWDIEGDILYLDGHRLDFYSTNYQELAKAERDAFIEEVTMKEYIKEYGNPTSWDIAPGEYFWSDVGSKIQVYLDKRGVLLELSASNIKPEEETIVKGETSTIDVDVSNTSSFSGNAEVVLTMDGNEIAREPISIGANKTLTVKFDIVPKSTGDFEFCGLVV